ncbi:sigma-70 family RNA polymerase sigma factor [Pontiellaceae bacterium B12227]|nr:sigma-70 family RNA polymerase sigma factor [Pontiellaceae bacterium B12227]
MNDTNTLNFDLLVREHQAGLRAFIRALGTDEAWVDDLAQEAFIIAYKKRGQFRKDEDFGKWLRGIARRLVMGERSKSARRYRILHDGITDILLSLGIEKHEPAPGRVKAVETMKGCVEQLPEAQRELLKNRYQEGRQAKEIATELKSTAAAIRKQLQRIRAAVRRCMEHKISEVAS